MPFTRLAHSRSGSFSIAEAMRLHPMIEWTASPDGLLDFYNRHWFRYTGMTLEQARGTGWMNALHPDDLIKSLTLWEGALASGQPFALECRLRRADGCYRWHRGEGMPIHDDNGTITKWFGVVIDIHEQQSSIRLAMNENEESNSPGLVTTLSALVEGIS